MCYFSVKQNSIPFCNKEKNTGNAIQIVISAYVKVIDLKIGIMCEKKCAFVEGRPEEAGIDKIKYL